MVNKWMLCVKPEIPNKVILTFTRQTETQTKPETYKNRAIQVHYHINLRQYLLLYKHFKQVS
jgi:hypothetical protein